MKWIFRLLLITLLLYLLALLYLYLMQRKILFHPSHTAPAREGFFLGEGEEKIWIEIRNPGKKNALIYFPGNSERYWESPDDLAAHFPDRTLYFPHYRGYGASAGSPSQEAFFSDALRLYDRIRQHHDSILLIGRSLGSGVAVRLASQRPVKALILITPYDSITRLGQKRYPLFPVRRIIKDPFESWRYAAEIHTPTLLILAENDQVIPHENSHALAHAFPEPPSLVTLPGTDHGNIVDHPDYYPTIEGFLRRRRASES
ncbi:alpha/beta hydrolase [Nitratifractor sp.]